MQYGSWTNLYLCNVYFATPDGKSQQFGETGANSAVCS
jgi:hypothetical protein